MFVRITQPLLCYHININSELTALIRQAMKIYFIYLVSTEGRLTIHCVYMCVCVCEPLQFNNNLIA